MFRIQLRRDTFNSLVGEALRKMASNSAAEDHRALDVLRKYPRHPSMHYAYGTAGFRFEIDETYADTIFMRAGMLACARSRFLKQAVGLCITASHNPVKDNGVKIVDPDGGMLAPSWESIAVKAANAATEEECLSILLAVCSDSDMEGVVIVGRDTRPHSARLEQAAIEGIESFKGRAVSIGVVTTPQLHYSVMRENKIGYLKNEASVEGYVKTLTESYRTLVRGTAPCLRDIYVDCANGVGATMFKPIAEALKPDGLRCHLFNTDTAAFTKLNDGCGAEHVQKQRMPPADLPHDGTRFASFDGDADRIVFYCLDQKGFVLLDGDKIASLAALFISTQMRILREDGFSQDASIGAVQTAYANGSSSVYLKASLGVEAPLVKTGVKHLHHKALDYDFGIYFEANGHGTVLFKERIVEALRTFPASSEKGKLAKQRLCAAAELFNQATGDAMADLLVVDGMLRTLGYEESSWDALYSDLPSKQLKVKVVDRSVVVTNDDETRCIEPASLQTKVDVAVKSVGKGRAFVRPSGTEDVVRVYAEAQTQSEADSLAEACVQAIMTEAGGIYDSKKTKTG